jgi:thiol:disulfide interchange protein DsbD
MLFATIFFGLAIYMAPALGRRTPQGIVGEGLIAFLPLDTAESAGGSSGNPNGKLEWHLYYEKAWEQARSQNKPIFIDFTGVNCTNCRANENRVFPLPAVRKELEKYVRVQMYNDSVPDRTLTAAQAKEQADINSSFQSNTFGDISTPLYVIFQPAKDAPFADGKLKGVEVDRRSGYISDVADFIKFLENPQGKQVAQGK